MSANTAELYVPGLILPQKHHFQNDIQTKIPLWDFQNPVKKSQRSTKMKTAVLKWIRRAISLAPRQPLFQATTVWHQARTAQLLTFPWERNHRSGVCLQHSSSLEGCLKDGFLTWLIWSTDRTGIARMPECCKDQRKVRGGILQAVQFGMGGKEKRKTCFWCASFSQSCSKE